MGGCFGGWVGVLVGGRDGRSLRVCLLWLDGVRRVIGGCDDFFFFFLNFGVGKFHGVIRGVL